MEGNHRCWEDSIENYKGPAENPTHISAQSSGPKFRVAEPEKNSLPIHCHFSLLPAKR